MFDVTIIGGGVIGCLIARELSRYELKICLIERESDVAMGASGANSGIVHAGYDPKPGTLKAKFNISGNLAFEQLTRELDVPLYRRGSLVLAFDEYEEQKLIGLLENGRENGVPSLALLSREEVQALEPLVSVNVTSALYAPTAAVTCPYSLTIAAAENAAANGAELYLNREVLGIESLDGVFTVRTTNGTFASRFVVNAAGVYAGAVSEMAGAENYAVKPRKGEYMLFDKTVLKPKHILFQAPGKMGKGVLVTETAHGNLLVGPSAKDVPDREDTSVTAEGLSYVAASGLKSFPHFRQGDAITEFAGLRAISESKDFIIEPSERKKGFIHVAGIASPGLTAAPAIARHVARLLEGEGLALTEKKDFDPIRKGITAFHSLTSSEQNALIAADPTYGKIVCRCETISEAEIVESIRRPAGATTLDGVKRRVRPGMGRCQGGFCSSAVLRILSRELGLPLGDVTKRGRGSYILTGKTK
jgi:glycerol-3-phosphate dehydrogenase